jgi:hypothetical protein
MTTQKSHDLFYAIKEKAEKDKEDKFKAHMNKFKYEGQLSFVYRDAPYEFKDLPKFEDFPAEKASTEIAPDIDWSSNKRAQHYRTRLKEGLKKGANFNGHYAVITHGCGSPCQVNWIVNVNNGKVLGAIETALGAAYRVNSSLIVANLPSSIGELEAQLDAEALDMNHIIFFKIENDQIRTVKDFQIYKEIEAFKNKK